MIEDKDDSQEHEVEIVNTTDIDPERILNVLRNVFDPEIFFSIYDIGLIYKIEITDKQIIVTMTLTSANCPEAQSIPDEVFQKIQFEFPDHEILVNITFDPTWTVDNMADVVKLKLGLL